jgi:zeaxanthin glucosyltransferase
MRFGIICPPVPGHLHGMMTVGRELRRRGHDVHLLGITDVARHASNGYVDFFAIARELTGLERCVSLFAVMAPQQ